MTLETEKRKLSKYLDFISGFEIDEKLKDIIREAIQVEVNQYLKIPYSPALSISKNLSNIIDFVEIKLGNLVRKFENHISKLSPLLTEFEMAKIEDRISIISKDEAEKHYETIGELFITTTEAFTLIKILNRTLRNLKEQAKVYESSQQKLENVENIENENVENEVSNEELEEVVENEEE